MHTIPRNLKVGKRKEGREGGRKEKEEGGVREKAERREGKRVKKEGKYGGGDGRKLEEEER